MADDEQLHREVTDLVAGRGGAAGLARASRLALSSMRAAGARAVVSGRWLADVALDVAPRLPVRDLATLEAHHGRSGPELAEALVRNAARVTATLGATAGTLAAVQGLASPAWAALPAELMVETLAVAAVEMKLVAELHEVHGRPVGGGPAERGVAIARAWAERRGVTPDVLARRGGLSDVLGRGARREVTRLVQRRLVRRTVQSTPALVPFLAGAVAGAEVNRRATRSLGESIIRDLAAR